MIDTQPGNSPGERGIVMKRIVYLTLMLIGLMAACILTGCKSGTKLENLVVDKENNIISCEYEGVKREIIVSLPETAKNAPLIVMLHGAGDSADNFLKSSEFDKEANEKGYAVCFISGSINSKAGRNSRSWNYGRIDTDYDDVSFIKEVVKYVCDEYSLDDDDVYCAGFSNGGFMNFRLALEAQDVFKACVSVGGDLCKTLWNKKPEKNDVSFMAVAGEKDESVPKNADGTAKTSLDPAIEDVIEYLADSNGLAKQSESEIGKGSTIVKYGADGDNDAVWYVVVKDGKHGWPTVKLNDFSMNQLVLEFFASIK